MRFFCYGCFCLNITLKMWKHCRKWLTLSPLLLCLCAAPWVLQVSQGTRLVLQQVSVPVRLLHWQVTLFSPGPTLSLKVRDSIWRICNEKTPEEPAPPGAADTLLSRPLPDKLVFRSWAASLVSNNWEARQAQQPVQGEKKKAVLKALKIPENLKRFWLSIKRKKKKKTEESFQTGLRPANTNMWEMLTTC